MQVSSTLADPNPIQKVGNHHTELQMPLFLSFWEEKSLNLTLSESLLLLHKWPTSNEDRTLHKQIQDMQQTKAKWAENFTSIQTVRQSAVHVKWIFMSKSEANITPLNALLTLELAWWRSWSWSYLRRVFFMQVAPGSNMIASKSSGWCNWKLIFFREVFQNNFTDLHGASFASFAPFFCVTGLGSGRIDPSSVRMGVSIVDRGGWTETETRGDGHRFLPWEADEPLQDSCCGGNFRQIFRFFFFQLSSGIPFLKPKERTFLES